MTKLSATCTSVVMRPGMTWFAAAGQPATFSPTPAWATTDLNRVVLAAQTLWFRNRPEGVVLWQAPPDNAKAPGALRPMLHAMLTAARERGCTVSDAGLTTGWFTFLHEGYPTVMLGIGPLISQSRTTFGDLREEPYILADRLARYADLTGGVWRGTGGLSGTASIRTQHEAHEHTPMWRWKRPKDMPMGMVGSSFELSPSKHSRPLSADQRRGGAVHHFDIRAMYLAAAGVAMLGWSTPEHTGPREFDPGFAGYWQVRRDQLDAIALPEHVMRSTVYRQGDSHLLWATTPVLTYMTEHGGSPEVFDSWTCKRTGRYLREWSARLTAARTALRTPRGGSRENLVDDGVARALKDTYARTVGMFNRETSRVYRPDWWDTCRDTARINLVRKVQAANVAPCRYNVDSIWVPSGERYAHQVGAALGIKYIDSQEADQVGKFKLVQTYSEVSYLKVYERQALAA